MLVFPADLGFQRLRRGILAIWAVDKGGRCVDTYGVINKNCEVALLQRDWFMRKSVLTAAIFVAGITVNSAAGAATLNVCHGGQCI